MSEEREVTIGCGAWFIGVLLVSALWEIGAHLDQIAVQLTVANCLAEAKAAILCPAAKEKGK